MKKLILAALVIAVASAGRVEAQHPSGSLLGRGADYSTFVAPSSCTASSVALFLGSPVAMGCDSALTYTTATLAAPVHSGTSMVAAAPATVTITNATNATPIVVTATAHGLKTNDRISISGITGNTNANGYFRITRLSANTFSLQNYSTGADIAGNGVYGGAPVAVTGIVQAGRVMAGDGTAAAPSIALAAVPDVGFFRIGSAFAFAQGGNVYNVFGYSINGMQVAGGSGYTWSNNATNAAATTDLYLTRGGAAATLQLGAANAASPVAQTLSVQSVVSGTSNTAGQAFTIQGSLQTGNARPGQVRITGGALAASGTTQATAITTSVNNYAKILTNNSAISIVNLTNASNTAVGVSINYGIEVFNGTDVQYEQGEVLCMVTNKGGVWSGNTCVKHGNQQNMTSGTLAVTWAITGANPAVVSVNANSSLTPSTGYPRIFATIVNLGNQAIAPQ